MNVLVITEKPSVAEKIAKALGNAEQKKSGRTVCYEVKKEKEKIYVVPSVGHIFALKQKGKGWTYPTFEVEWVPSFEVSKSSAFTKAHYKNIEKISKKCDAVVIATDYDTEGSVIGYNILRFICRREDARRMKFSTLTTEELRDAYQNAGPLDVQQIEAGLARHVLDWLFGINLSRALTKALNAKDKGFTVLSTGRVQGPALKILAEREREIRSFVPTPFWQLEADMEADDGALTAYYEKDKIWGKEEAQKILKECKDAGEARVTSVERKEYKQPPPVPLDLTSLQIEAYGVFGFSPSATLELAQSLYEQGLISYPRTSSQKLPEKLGLDKIVSALSEQKYYKKLTKILPRPLKPNEGKKTDPAHPAIFPTGVKPEGLTEQQKRLYDLIVRRFLSVFAKPATRESMLVAFDIKGYRFFAEGSRTLDPQWIEIYGYAKFKDVVMPNLKENQMLPVLEVRVLDKETQPPKRFTEASLVRTLEKRNLGTKATRSEIVRTLYERSYVKGKSIVVTELGMGVVKTLEKYVPDILSEEMTRTLEKEMDAIMEGTYTKEKVIEDAQQALTPILTEFKENEQKISEALSETLRETRRRERTVGVCPKCGDDLRIIVAKASKKRFVGCSGYPSCATAYPLPQYGLVKTGDKRCEACGMPVVLVIRRGKRPWSLCIDPGCASKTKTIENQTAAQT